MKFLSLAFGVMFLSPATMFIKSAPDKSKLPNPSLEVFKNKNSMVTPINMNNKM